MYLESKLRIPPIRTSKPPIGPPMYSTTTSSSIGQAQGSGWYDEGSNATISVNTPVPAGYGQQYVFQKWVGTTEIPTSTAEIRVDKPITLDTIWQLDQTQLYTSAGAGAVGLILRVATAFTLGKRAGRGKTKEIPQQTRTGNPWV